MKKSLYWLLILSLSITIYSCSKSQNASASYSMDADINGAHFSAQGAVNVVTSLTVNSSDASKKQLVITGTSNNRHIILSIPNYSVSQSTYTIDLTGNGALAVYSSGTGPDFIANSGTLTVTRSGSVYQGSFNFNTSTGLSATNGTFSAQ